MRYYYLALVPATEPQTEQMRKYPHSAHMCWYLGGQRGLGGRNSPASSNWGGGPSCAFPSFGQPIPAAGRSPGQLRSCVGQLRFKTTRPSAYITTFSPRLTHLGETLLFVPFLSAAFLLLRPISAVTEVASDSFKSIEHRHEIPQIVAMPSTAMHMRTMGAFARHASNVSTWRARSRKFAIGLNYSPADLLRRPSPPPSLPENFPQLFAVRRSTRFSPPPPRPSRT